MKTSNFKKFSFLILLLLSLVFTVAQIPNIYNNCEIYGNCVEIFFEDVDNTTFISNGSAFWNTISLGPLDDANDTQFNGNDATLSIDTAWLELFGDGEWLELSGGNANQNIDIGAFSFEASDIITPLLTHPSGGVINTSELETQDKIRITTEETGSTDSARLDFYKNALVNEGDLVAQIQIKGIVNQLTGAVINFSAIDSNWLLKGGGFRAPTIMEIFIESELPGVDDLAIRDWALTSGNEFLDGTETHRDDNTNDFFGTSNDASIDYNPAVGLVLDPDRVGILPVFIDGDLEVEDDFEVNGETILRGGLNMTSNTITEIFCLNFSNGDQVCGNNSIDINIAGINTAIFSNNNTQFLTDVNSTGNYEGQRYFAATGSQTAPAFTSSSDSDNGMYFATNFMGLVTNEKVRVSISNSGIVFNELGNDFDLRAETNDNANMINLDGLFNTLTFGGSAVSGAAVNFKSLSPTAGTGNDAQDNYKVHGTTGATGVPDSGTGGNTGGAGSDILEELGQGGAGSISDTEEEDGGDGGRGGVRTETYKTGGTGGGSAEVDSTGGTGGKGGGRVTNPARGGTGGQAESGESGGDGGDGGDEITNLPLGGTGGVGEGTPGTAGAQGARIINDGFGAQRFKVNNLGVFISGDNNNLLFGAATTGDASIDYDPLVGLVLDPDVVGSLPVFIAGDLKVEGNFNLSNNTITDIQCLNFSNGDSICGDNSIDVTINETTTVHFAENETTFLTDVTVDGNLTATNATFDNLFLSPNAAKIYSPSAGTLNFAPTTGAANIIAELNNAGSDFVLARTDISVNDAHWSISGGGSGTLQLEIPEGNQIMSWNNAGVRIPQDEAIGSTEKGFLTLGNDIFIGGYNAANDGDFFLLGVNSDDEIVFGEDNLIFNTTTGTGTFSGDLNISNATITDIECLNFSNGDTICGESSIEFTINDTFLVRFAVNNTQFIGDVENRHNLNNFSRFFEHNINSGNFATSVYTAQNDLDFNVHFGITSSGFDNGNVDILANQGFLFFQTSNTTLFANGGNTGFKWLNNPSNSKLFTDTNDDLMTLSNEGDLNITGNLTVNLINSTGIGLNFIEGNLSVFELVVRNPGSIVLGGFSNVTGEPFSVLSAGGFNLNLSDNEFGRRVVLLDKDFLMTVNRTNGTIYLASSQSDDSEFAIAVTDAVNSVGWGFQLLKMSVNWSKPHLNRLLGHNGEMDIRTTNTNLTDFSEGITIGFMGIESFDLDFDITGFNNETDVIFIENSFGLNPFLTTFFYDVNFTNQTTFQNITAENLTVQNIKVEQNINQTIGNAFINNIYGYVKMKNESGVVIDLVSPGVYVNITSITNGSVLNGISYDGDHAFTIDHSGTYEVSASVAFVGPSAKVFTFDILVNDVMQNIFVARLTTANAEASVSLGPYALSLNEGDVVTLAMADGVTPVDPTVIGVQFGLRRIGN